MVGDEKSSGLDRGAKSLFLRVEIVGAILLMSSWCQGGIYTSRLMGLVVPCRK